MTQDRKTSSSSPIDGASILVVDDEKHIRLMLKTILQAEGCTVVEAADGREALEKVHASGFDVMILDLNMPVLDGMGVLEQLKQSPPAHPPRVIVLTAYGSISAAVRATRLGAMDFLEKPGSPEEVRESVAAVLRQPLGAGLTPATDELDGGYEAVLARVRKSLRMVQIADAESLLMRAADLAEKDPAYFNLLGVLYELRKQWALARKFYGKSMRAGKNYEPAQQNMRRIYELYTLGRSKEPIALGDGCDIVYAQRSA
jgi:CheY-like chemotaxis protein